MSLGPPCPAFTRHSLSNACGSQGCSPSSSDTGPPAFVAGRRRRQAATALSLPSGSPTLTQQPLPGLDPGVIPSSEATAALGFALGDFLAQSFPLSPCIRSAALSPGQAALPAPAPQGLAAPELSPGQTRAEGVGAATRLQWCGPPRRPRTHGTGLGVCRTASQMGRKGRGSSFLGSG